MTHPKASRAFGGIFENLDLQENLPEIVCARISVRDFPGEVFLKKGYTDDDFDSFLDEIEKYDPHNLDFLLGMFGVIWLVNGDWIERKNYPDRLSLEWRYRTKPPIPEECEGPPVTKSAHKR